MPTMLVQATSFQTLRRLLQTLRHSIVTVKRVSGSAEMRVKKIKANGKVLGGMERKLSGSILRSPLSFVNAGGRIKYMAILVAAFFAVNAHSLGRFALLKMLISRALRSPASTFPTNIQFLRPNATSRISCSTRLFSAICRLERHCCQAFAGMVVIDNEELAKYILPVGCFNLAGIGHDTIFGRSLPHTLTTSVKSEVKLRDRSS